MTAEIQQAESAIKAGDTKTGFEILRQLLAENPESERAWWIMSGLVQRKERSTCLEQVLRINPENQFARDALDQLQASPPKPETKPVREIPRPPVKETKPQRGFQTWLYTRGSKIYLTILGEKRLIRAQTEPDLFPKVRDAIKKGEIPDQLITEMKTIPLASIVLIKGKGAAFQVHYQDGPVERSLHFAMEDQAKAKFVMSVLTKRLGSDFVIQTKKAKIGLMLGISAVLSFGAAGLTALGFWAVQEVISGNAAETGSIQSPSMIRLLEFLGPLGVIILGAILLIIALGISAMLLLKPPTATELVRRE